MDKERRAYHCESGGIKEGHGLSVVTSSKLLSRDTLHLKLNYRSHTLQMANFIRIALLFFVVALVAGERDIDRFVAGRPVATAPGIQALGAGAPIRPSTRPFARPSQGGFAVPNPGRPQVQPRPQGPQLLRG